MKEIEILSGDEKEQLVEIYSNDILQEFDLVCMEQNIDKEDLKKGGEKNGRQFSYILIQIGKHLFKGSDKLKDKSRTINGHYNVYDVELIDLLLTYYVEICHLYNKTINESDFLNMIGIATSTFKNKDVIDSLLNDKHLSLKKKIRDLQEKDIITSFNNSNQAIKNIAVVNHLYGWNENVSNPNNVNISVKLESLPRFGIESKQE